MGACCEKLAKAFAQGEPDAAQHNHQRQQRTRELREPLIDKKPKKSSSATPAAGANNEKSYSSQSISGSTTDEFVPVDEEHLYIDSYWWAQPKSDTENDAPWKKKANSLASATALQASSANSDLIRDVDPFERHPFFTMNIKRLTKTKAQKLAAASAASRVKTKKDNSAEELKEEEQAPERTSQGIDYDPDEVPHIYPPTVVTNPSAQIPESIDTICYHIHDAFKLDPEDRDRKLGQVFGSISVVERAFVPTQYHNLFGVSLLNQIQGALQGPFGNLVQLLCVPIEEAEVNMIEAARTGKWMVRDEHLTRIICGRTNQEIAILQEKYKEMTNQSLDDVLDSELRRGGFKTYLKFCLEGMTEEYDPKNLHSKDNAVQKAKELYDSGEKKFGTDTDAFFKILLQAPPPFLRQMDKAYSKNYNRNISKAIKNELTFSNEYAVLYGTGMAMRPWLTVAKAMERTFKGVGMDAIGFNELIVRYRPYLQYIAKDYEEKFSETLLDRIAYEAKGHHYELLTNIVNNAPTPREIKKKLKKAGKKKKGKTNKKS